MIATADDVGVDVVDLTDDSLAKVAELLPGLGRVVNVEIDPSRVIPEIGVGGWTDPEGEVFAYLNDAYSIEADQLRTWLPDILAHEAHHSVRIRQGPGHGTTLGEWIVSEGLAAVFAREVFPDTPLQPSGAALDDKQARVLWALARPLLTHTPPDRNAANALYGEWFHGAGSIPRWAGYALGFGVVNAYLSNHPSTTAATLVHEPAESIIAGSGYTP